MKAGRLRITGLLAALVLHFAGAAAALLLVSLLG